jgi:hypothetical protein
VVARGAPIYAQNDVRMLDSIDLMSLCPADRWIYEGGLWKLAVRERTSVLPKWKYGTVNLGRILNVSTKYLRLALKRIADKSMIRLIEGESVIIYGVKERHRKLQWRDLPLEAPNGESALPRNVQIGSIRGEGRGGRDERS